MPGAVMLTPGIGPATDGLSGLALLACSQATARSTRPQTPAKDSAERIETSPYRAIGSPCAELYSGATTIRWERTVRPV